MKQIGNDHFIKVKQLRRFTVKNSIITDFFIKHFFIRNIEFMFLIKNSAYE